jgi:branched-chain amino acid transport system ATP-binding protein
MALLLDEPGSGIGEERVPELMRFVRFLAEHARMAVVLVEHNVDIVMRVCDRVIVMDFGEVIAEGSPAEIRRDPRVIASYLGGPVGGETPSMGNGAAGLTSMEKVQVQEDGG